MKNKVLDIDSGLYFDSTHEIYFFWYIQELKKAGYIDKFRLSKTHMLSDVVNYITLDSKNRIKTKTLIREKTYSDDFAMQWNESARDIFYQLIHIPPKQVNLPFISNLDLVNDVKPISVVDVKNPFNKDNVKRIFKDNQKFMYFKFKTYVQDIDVIQLFGSTFTPERFLLTDSGKNRRKINHPYRNLEKYVQVRKEINE